MPSTKLSARLRNLGALLCIGVLLQACGSSEGQETFYLARAINLVPDSAGQTIEVGELSFQAAFGTGTGFSSAFAGSGEIEVRAFVPGATVGDAFVDTLVLKPAETIEFEDATSYTIINYGTVADFRSITLTAPVPDTIDTSVIRLQFVHAALGAGNVDIYVTTPDADLANSAVTTSLGVGQVSTPSNEAVSDYRIRLTSPGTTSVIFDSGTLSPTTPGDRLFVIGKTTGPTSTPVFLSRWSSQGAPLAISDINTPAYVRLLHLVPGTGALDLIAEDDYANPIAVNTAFGQQSAYGEVRDTLPDGVSVLSGTEVSFVASANDAEEGDLSANIIWSSSIDGALAGTGGEIAETLSPGTHSVIASATDSAGITGSAAVRVTILTTGNAAPVVQVLSPQNGKEFAAGTAITFTATANDSEDGDLAASLTWTSNIDGALTGTGASVTAVLSPGIHAVTASAADTTGLVGSESVIVSVMPASGSAPVVSISAPDFLTAIEFDLALTGDPDNVVLQNLYEVFDGTAYTLTFTDPSGVPGAALLADAVQRVATHSLVRVVNASDIAGAVDIYFSAPGAGIAGTSAFFTNVRSGLDSGVGPVAASTYDVTFTTAGSSDIVLVIPSLTLATAQSNTIALVDDDANMLVDYLRIAE